MDDNGAEHVASQYGINMTTTPNSINICLTSEEDSCIGFLQALPDRDPVFMK